MNDEIKQRIAQIKSGQVPYGYKKTDVGIIPSDWEEKSLGDLFEFNGGLGIPREELGDKGIAYLHYGDMHRKFFTKADYNEYLNMPKYDININGEEKYLLKDGDMVFLDASEDLEGTSRCVVVDNADNRPFISGLHTFVGKPKNADLDKNYKQFLSMPQMVRKQFQRLASGFKVYGVNRTSIKGINIAYPKDINEQKRIAEVLSKWDEVIDLQEKLIDKLEMQKKAIMQKLLTPKSDWNCVPLKKILKERKMYSIKDLDYVHVTLSKKGVCDKTDQYDRDFLVSSEEKKYKITHYNDLCYNPANLKFGVICLNKYGDAIFSPIYVTFEINNEYNCDFIGDLLTSSNFINRVRRFEEGSIYERQAVKPEDFIKEKVLIPNKNCQDKIANTILCMDKIIKSNGQKLDKLKQQRKALQQLLLTGTVRV